MPARDHGKEPLVLTLAGPQPAPVTARLRQAGFRWSKVLRHWEGLARPDEATSLAAELGATLRRVEAEPPPAPGVHAAAAE